MEDTMPDLLAHFKEERIEIHMFASQWFLTLFATKVVESRITAALYFTHFSGLLVLADVGATHLRLLPGRRLQHYFSNESGAAQDVQ